MKLNLTFDRMPATNHKTLADALVKFFTALETPKVPRGISVMNPYQDRETMDAVRAFYRKFFHDSRPRTLLLGINPGRFGAGATGISFTDPTRLETVCGIPNHLPKKPELSSDFIYRMIAAFGGPETFYARYLVSAVSPLGFTRDGKNINYYDDKKLEEAIRPFASRCISQLMEMGLKREVCYCIGEGKNFDYLHELNQEHHWFDQIIPLAHPRFIMQYRRKQLETYIKQYIDLLA
ncbi:MAG: DUF4918 family protein [Cyclobacteriaceae bacterium]|nr:DUF4918 family protein [Cyclobacteriaceae bacterium]